MKDVMLRNICFVVFLALCLSHIPGFAASPAAEAKNISDGAKRLHTHVTALSSIEPPRYHKNVASLAKAAAYIHTQFKKYTPRVAYQDYTADNKTYRNVIASFGPEKGEHIILGAHYDVCGPVPGADDNASGVAVLIEVARKIHQLKPTLKNPITLVTYPLEEPPHFRSENMGSAVHAKSLRKAGTAVRVMISVDMIGYFANYPKNRLSTHFRSYVTAGKVVSGNTAGLLGRKGDEILVRKVHELMAMYSTVNVIACNPPLGTATMDFSDHLFYWKNGYTALLLSNFFVCLNPHYHQKGDTVEKVDFERLNELKKGLYGVVVNL